MMSSFECRCEKGIVHTLTATPQVTYVCPENGTFVYCEECKGTRSHRSEVLWPKKASPPQCPTHRVLMVVQP
jgi:hypothetical protein